MRNKFIEALEDLKEKQIIYRLVDPAYEAVAYSNMKAAEERVNAIIKEMKGEVRNDVRPVSRQAI